MIRVHKSPMFTRWFAWSCERRLRRTFDVRVAGLAEVTEVARAHPIVLLANHTSWWDALVALVVSARVLQLDAFALMESDNLQRLRFFGLAGAVGFHRGDPRDGARVIRHGAALLDRPGRALWIFPQGEQRPATELPRFQGGGVRIARLAGAWIVPVALRYGFGTGPRPELSVACGRPLPPDAADPNEQACADVTRLLAELDARTLPTSAAWPLPREHTLAAALLDRVAGAWSTLRRRRLEAAIATEPQRAIGPAHASADQAAHERAEQHQIGGQRQRELANRER